MKKLIKTETEKFEKETDKFGYTLSFGLFFISCRQCSFICNVAL